MAFLIAMKDTYRADIMHLSRDMLRRSSQAIDKLEQNPIEPHGDTIKKLRHHQNLWRYRIGDYRLVYAAYPEQKLVQLIAIGPRGEIYDRLGYRPDEADYPDYAAAFEQALDPNRETPAEWWQYAQRTARLEDGSRTLPYQLTSAQLTNWHIARKYHDALVGCKTEDQLLHADVPQEVLYHLMDCLWPPNAQAVTQAPNLLVGKSSDLERYAQGDWINFVLLLDEDQKRLVDFSLRGPTLVKGGPGSGKSTVALYRVRTLVEHCIHEKKPARILFTTYTNALIEASRQLIDRLLLDVPGGLAQNHIGYDIKTIDKVAMDIVSSVSERPNMASNADLKASITAGRVAFRPESHNRLEQMAIKRAVESLRDDYLQEEFEWVIEGRGLSRLEEYLQTDRTGRGYAFDARLRRAVWQLYQHSQEFIHKLNKITWGELRLKALEAVMASMWTDKWDYVLVDEAQDLTPVALALALEVCCEPGGLFLTADACQSLYNRGFAWKNVHESMRVAGRTRLLKRNYRTTRQISTAAANLLQADGAGDEEALDQVFVHVGPKPKAYEAVDEDDMFIWLANQIQSSARELKMPVSAAAVLAPTNELARQAAARLSMLGLNCEYMSGRDLDLSSPCVKALTIHAAKGLEFPIVAIPYVEEGSIPYSLADERADDLDKHLAHERRVLFVGCTRAMRRLFIAYRQDIASRFVQQLDPHQWELEQFV